LLVAKKEVYSYVEDRNVIATKEVKKIKRRKNNSLLKVKFFGLALLTLFICLGVLFGYAQITQVKMEVSKLDKEIVELKKHKVDISLELERIKDSGWIEKEAEDRLGMIYPEDEQVIYLSVLDHDINISPREVGMEEKLGFIKLFSNMISKISDKF